MRLISQQYHNMICSPLSQPAQSAPDSRVEDIQDTDPQHSHVMNMESGFARTPANIGQLLTWSYWKGSGILYFMRIFRWIKYQSFKQMLQQNPWLRSFSLLLPVVMSAAGMIGHFICMHGIWQPLNRWKVQSDLFSNLKCKHNVLNEFQMNFT